MDRLPSFHRFIAPLPIRWRLALVSFGLLVVLLASLGLLLSVTEENALLAGQATVLKNEADLAQLQLWATKAPLQVSQISTFPAMSKNIAYGLLPAVHYILGQNVGISILSFDGSTLAADADGSIAHNKPVVTLVRSSVQQWFAARPTSSYLLTNDNQGQREMVVLQPIVGWNKSVSEQGTTEDPPGYSKALLQLSVPTTAIDQSVATTRLILVLGILAAVGIAAALTLPLINVALRPLVEMERVSSRIAAGSLSLRLAEPPAQDEIGRLARSFNSMVARLEATFARQRRFVADVSHELRTPLTGLGGSLEMLLLRADGGDEQTVRRLMSGMHAEVERMQLLVADLLALTRLGEGRVKLHMEVVDVSQLVCEVCEQIQRLLHGQELCYRVPSDLPALRGDINQLRRVLLNVVENAVKFTPPAGRVELVVHGQCAGFVTFEVRDTGIGVPPEALPHIFDRFYRADPSRTRLSLQAGGNGLGLSIAKELVEAHGGTIAMSSIVAKGTAVTIRLPALPCVSAASELSS